MTPTTPSFLRSPIVLAVVSGCCFNINKKSKKLQINLKTRRGSSAKYALSNYTISMQCQTGGTVPLRYLRLYNMSVPDHGSRDRDVVLVRRIACWGNPGGPGIWNGEGLGRV
jgi:hypothetical protein